MIEMPPELAACASVFHDTGDEDSGEPVARQRILYERQTWKADTFFGRVAFSAGTGPEKLGAERHAGDSDDYSARAVWSAIVSVG